MNDKKRSSGVLLNISALPSPFGIGVIGREAEEFAQKIASAGFSYWQILPLNPLDCGNSPYASDGAFASNTLYLDPRVLRDEGLLSDDDVNLYLHGGDGYCVDYDFARRTHAEMTEKAYRNFTDTGALDRFLESKHNRDYAFYSALKEQNDGLPFYKWDKKQSHYDTAQQLYARLEDRIRYFAFCQYEFSRQWSSLKRKINDAGVEIIGDMPIYVNLDSADVWANAPLFAVSPATFSPRQVAGVPPDYFSEDGQLWGNPLFNWKKMSEDNYSWWCDRIENALRLYDTVRIDHFRGIASYWAVGAGEKTARGGKWKKGPGMKLFDAVKKRIADPPVIAEDLGVYGEDVVRLLADTGFAGMRVIQFGFDEPDSTHLPHNYPYNSIAYTGTHDNNTVLGWLLESDAQRRAYALDYCSFRGDAGEGGYHSPPVRAVTETVWRSASRLAVVPFQDMCGYGSDTRMNTPGKAENNWLFRATDEAMDSLDLEYFTRLNKVFGRA